MNPRTLLSFGILLILTLGGAAPLRAAPRIDFDGDGFADLAVGVPHEDVGVAADAGAVNILYGSEDGLTEVRSQFFTQGTRGVPGGVQAGAQFGKALAAGDFNGDGFTDLAVGVPGYDLPFLPDGGMVVIFFGGAGGLSPSRSSFLIWLSWFDRNSLFGSALAAGDFDGDGFADLAVGAPDYVREPQNTPGSGRGTALVWYGSRFGMERRQRWQQGANGLRETAEYRDQFGAALATGDFNCDGDADLAIGVPGEAGIASLSFGAVSVLYGSSEGLGSAGNQVWTQNSDGGGNEAQEGDRYGEILGRGDFDGDGCDELLVGAPGDVSVHIIYGTADGLDSDRTDEIFGPLPGFVSADLDDDGIEDLAMRRGGGGVRIFLGRRFGLSDVGFTLEVFRMPGLNPPNDPDDSQVRTARAGYALAADDFQGFGVDLAVGIPSYHILYKHNLLQIPSAGAVAVFGHSAILSARENGSAWSGFPIIQRCPELDCLEGFSIHEVGDLAEPDDSFGEVFSR